MKSFLLIITFSMLISCGQNKVSEIPGTDTVPDTSSMNGGGDANPGPILVSQGQLQPRNGYSSSGSVSLIYDEEKDEYSIALENFASSNGPDLHVYISADSNANDFHDLGELRSISGTLVYTMPASRYNEDFNTVLVWCKSVNESFGEANLE